MLNLLYISLGGALGALARYSLSLGLASKSMNFPTATLCTNIVGCFLMGMITEIFTLKANLPSELKLLIATGFLGAFTTFSTFGLESVSLINKAEFGKNCMINVMEQLKGNKDKERKVILYAVYLARESV